MNQIYSIESQSPLSAATGPAYLIVADETEEFDNALRYAVRAARAAAGQVAILYVMGDDGFVHWGQVEERVRIEKRREAEEFLLTIAIRAREIDNLEPVLLLAEGERTAAILKTLAANSSITKLILGGDTNARSPGPLVKYFTGKGMKHLTVPLTIVPDHLSPEKIDGFM